MPFFINADLEITAHEELDCIREEFGEAVVELGNIAHEDGSFFASFEIDAMDGDHAPEALILRFCAVVDSLSSQSRKVWDSATKRVIDLGYQTDEGYGVVQSDISVVALKWMHDLRIELIITIYPLEGKLGKEPDQPAIH